MSLHRFIIVFVAVVVIGLYTVWQRIDALRTGARVTKLDSIVQTLEEDNRRVRMQVRRMESTYELILSGDRLGINLEEYSELKIEDKLPRRLIYEDAENQPVSNSLDLNLENSNDE